MSAASSRPMTQRHLPSNTNSHVLRLQGRNNATRQPERAQIVHMQANKQCIGSMSGLFNIQACGQQFTGQTLLANIFIFFFYCTHVVSVTASNECTKVQQKCNRRASVRPCELWCHFAAEKIRTIQTKLRIRCCASHEYFYEQYFLFFHPPLGCFNT